MDDLFQNNHGLVVQGTLSTCFEAKIKKKLKI